MSCDLWKQDSCWPGMCAISELTGHIIEIFTHNHGMNTNNPSRSIEQERTNKISQGLRRLHTALTLHKLQTATDTCKIVWRLFTPFLLKSISIEKVCSCFNFIPDNCIRENTCIQLYHWSDKVQSMSSQARVVLFRLDTSYYGTSRAILT